jgi:acyl-CoA oxidase
MAYSIKFTGSWMLNRFKDIEGENRALKGLDDLPEIAATSSGLKALCTFFAWQGIEDCRKCCGGNGDLLVSGVAQMAADYAWQTTAEGVFIILTLQTAQFLLKSVQNAVTGKHLGEVVAYLAPLKDAANFDLAKMVPPSAKTPEEFYNLDYLVQLFRYSALSAVVNVSQEFQQRLGDLNGKFDEALNACAVELCNAVRSHTFVFMLSNFATGIAAVEDKGCKQALQYLAAFWACSNMVDDGQWIGILSSGQLRLVKTAVTKLLDLLRPNAIALTDAFDFPDNVLNSAIGRYDGNVYEALYDFARKSPLNQQEVFDGYQEVLRPHLDIEFLKNGNRKPKL